MAVYFLILIIVVSGFLAGLDKKKRFYFLKATFLVGIETIIGVVLFGSFFFVIMQTFLKDIFLAGIGSLFALVLLIAVIDGFIIYWWNRIFIPKLKVSHQVQTLGEYIIQWSLIYITVYQVIFDNFIATIQSASSKSFSVDNFSLTNPSDLIIIVLPTLISVWISIILYKTKENAI